MKMKRFLTILLSLTLVFSLAFFVSCGGGESSSSFQGSEGTAEDIFN